jgi:hypothetical protein
VNERLDRELHAEECVLGDCKMRFSSPLLHAFTLAFLLQVLFDRQVLFRSFR